MLQFSVVCNRKLRTSTPIEIPVVTGIIPVVIEI